MKEFINKHPYLTTGIIFGFYQTVTTIVSTLKTKSITNIIYTVCKSERMKDNSSNTEKDNDPKGE